MRQPYGLAILVAVLIATCCLGAVAFATSTTPAAARPGTVFGTISNGETGRLIVGVTIELLDANGKRVAGPVTSDKDGGYSIKAPQPGEYTVSAKHGDYESLATQIVVGLDPMPALTLKLNEYHVIDIPPDLPGTGEGKKQPILAALLSTLIPGLAIGLLLVIGAAKSRDLRHHQ